MKDILLSICISSYNRGQKCAKLVQDILTIEDDRYNIFICDDCSDNKNFDQLQPLAGKKVVLVKNEKNAGACPNWYRTICCGNGKYLLHILDRDDIQIHILVRLLDILENSSVAGGYVGKSAASLSHTISENTDYEVLEKGKEAFAVMAGVPVHPTGFLVNREYWLKGNFKKFFYEQKKYGIYPHSYVLGKLAARADLLYMPVVFWESSYRGCNRRSRFYAKSDQKDYWWLPDSVIKTANCFMLYLYPLAGEAGEQFLCNRLREGIYRSTIGYKNTVAKKAEMARYGLEVCKVSKSRMLLILLKYRICFCYVLRKLDGAKSCSRSSLTSVWKQGFDEIWK